MPTPAERLIGPGSPFSLALSNGSSQRYFRHAPLTLPVLLERPRRSGARIFTSLRDAQASLAVIAEESDLLSAALVTAHGVARGCRVAVMASDSPAWIAAVFAIWRSGGVAVILSPDIGPETVIQILDAVCCPLLITTRSLSLQLRAYRDCRVHISVCNNLNWQKGPYFESGITRSRSELPRGAFSPALDPDEDAIIAFTSGSTGLPKGVISTHRAVISGVFNTLLSAALSGLRRNAPRISSTSVPASPCSLLRTPFSHVGGYSHLLLMLHIVGKVIPYRSDLPETLSVISQERVTLLSGAEPEILSDLINAPIADDNLFSLQSITTYGASLSTQAIQALHSRFPAIRVGAGYGLTETNGSVSSASGQDLLERPGTCGSVSPAIDICIRDDSGKAAQNGSFGGIWIRGPTLMRDYIRLDRSTPIEPFSGGWFYTGDVGRLDADGFLYVQGRRQDVLWNAGTLVSCRRLEELVHNSSPNNDVTAVLIQAACGQPHLLVAIAHPLTPSMRTALTETLNQASGLPPSRIALFVLDPIPRLHSGKPDRKALVKMAGFDGSVHVTDPL
jgi:long-chain acyl-CoA synthetase